MIILHISQANKLKKDTWGKQNTRMRFSEDHVYEDLKIDSISGVRK